MALPSLCVQVGRKRVSVFPQPDMSEIWVWMSLLVAVQFPWQGKEQNVHWCIRGFAKKHARASRILFKGGALPPITYGHQIWGIPPRIHEAFESCGGGPLGDTELECVPPLCLRSQKLSQRLVCMRKSLPSTLCFLRDNPLQIKRIERAWQLLLRRFERTARKRRWFQVTGDLPNVIAILLELNWKPVAATNWIDDLDDTWTFDRSKTFDLVPVVSDIKRASMR